MIDSLTPYEELYQMIRDGLDSYANGTDRARGLEALEEIGRRVHMLQTD